MQNEIVIADVIRWLLIVFVSAFFGAPLIMLSIQWWARALFLMHGMVL